MNTKVTSLALAVVSLASAYTSTAQIVNLNGAVRDFSVAGATRHPDFQDFIDGAVVPGIVLSTLAGGKPQYNPAETAGSVDNATTFGQWFNDTIGVNINLPLSIGLNDDGVGGDATNNDGIFTFSDSTFFPIDGMGWGNQSLSHNYGFTFELHTLFGYDPLKDVFSFTGDDDVWVFVNGQLVIDLGGVHQAASATVDLSTIPGLGLVAGQNYSLDFFFAERHTSESSFKISTSIALGQQGPGAVPEPSTYGLIGAALLVGAAVIRRRRAQKA